MPERVWLTEGMHGDGQWYGQENTITRLGCYVPESRLREVEAENAQLRRIIEQRANGTDLLTEQLRAERDALVPLAAYGYNDLEMDCPSGPWPLVPNDEERAAARAVLARRQEGV